MCINTMIQLQYIFKNPSTKFGKLMGNLLKHPITDIKYTQLKSQLNVSVTCATVQGWRQYMQDFHIVTQLGNEIILAGVFDGHGGPEVAKYVSSIIGKQLQNQPYFAMKNYNKALINLYKRIDEMINSMKGQQQLKKIHKQLCPHIQCKTDLISLSVGCTSNLLLLTNNKIYIANIGDSRAVLCRNGIAINLSQDHKPDISNQRNRILKAGGEIIKGRINGSINISRTFGDYNFKINQHKGYDQQMVISVPDVKQINRQHNIDQYIIIASDGVWQKYINNSQLLIDQINKIIVKSQNWKQALQLFLHSLIPNNMNQTSGYDNMTIILVILGEQGKRRLSQNLENVAV